MELPDLLSLAARACSFILLLQASGIALFIATFARGLSLSQPRLRRLGWLSALWAVALTIVHELLEGARMTGTLSGAADPEMLAIALRSSAGAAFAVTLLGIALVATGCRLAVSALGVCGALLLAVAFTLTGHTSTSPQRILAAPLLGSHVLIVQFWLGAVVGLYIACAHESGTAAARIVARFSAVAVWVVPGLFVAGVVLTILLVPNLAVFRQPYGELLLTKASLFALLLGFAAVNKWRLGPGLAAGGAGVARFRSVVAVEYLLICAVLAATAIMTGLYSPEAA